MKFLIVLACLLAVAAANHDAKIVHSDSEVNIKDFKYAYELDNHIKASQQGTLKDHDDWVVTGDYEYISPEGEHIKLAYTADEHGYHPDPSSPLLPVPPPIPAHIAKALAYIEAHPPHEEHHDHH